MGDLVVADKNLLASIGGRFALKAKAEGRVATAQDVPSTLEPGAKLDIHLATRLVRTAWTLTVSSRRPMTVAREHDSRLEKVVPWVAGALLAAPVLLGRYPPMGDLPLHEAMVAVLAHLHDAAFAPPGLYALNLGEPNQLFHLLALLLSYVFATDTACKLVVGATVLATPVAAASLAKHLGASRWTALVVGPLALGWMFRWGLVANMLGFALLLRSLPTLDRLNEAPSLRRAAPALVFAVALYFAHESAMVVYCVAAVIFLARDRPGARDLALAASPIPVCLGLAALYAARAEGLKAASIRAIPTTFHPLGYKLSSLPIAVWSAEEYSLALFGLLLAVAAAFAWPRFARRSDDRVPRAPRAFIARYRFELLGCACFVAYLTFPQAFGGSTLLYQRFLPPAVALFVIGGAARRPLRPSSAERLACVAACAFPIAMLAVTAPGFLEADREFRDLDVVLAKIKEGSAVAQLDLTPRPPGVGAPVLGAGARALAARGGRLLFTFTDAPASPITIPAAHRWDEETLRLQASPFALAPEYDMTRFRYALVRNSEPNVNELIARAFLPEARLVAQAGAWMLFESTRPTVSLLAPDAPLPSPAPDSLMARIRKIVASHSPRR